MRITAAPHSSVRRSSILGIVAFACMLPCQASPLGASHDPRLEDCKVPAVSEPWRDSNQTSECRALELIKAMTLEDKIAHLSVSFGDPSRTALEFPLFIRMTDPMGSPRDHSQGLRPLPRWELRHFPMRSRLPRRGTEAGRLSSVKHSERNGAERAVRRLSRQP